MLLWRNAGCSTILATSAVTDINHVDETSLYTTDISSGNNPRLMTADTVNVSFLINPSMPLPLEVAVPSTIFFYLEIFGLLSACSSSVSTGRFT